MMEAITEQYMKGHGFPMPYITADFTGTEQEERYQYILFIKCIIDARLFSLKTTNI